MKHDQFLGITLHDNSILLHKEQLEYNNYAFSIKIYA